MEGDIQVPRPSKAALIVGWIMSILPSLGLLFSGVLKLIKPQMVVDEFVRLGYSANLARPIGIVELGCVVLYLIPRTSILGAILVTGYLGGAVATHVRIGEQFVGPVIFGVVVWLGLFLREPRLRTLIPLRR